MRILVVILTVLLLACGQTWPAVGILAAVVVLKSALWLVEATFPGGNSGLLGWRAYLKFMVT